MILKKKEKKIVGCCIEKFESIITTDGFGLNTRVYISKRLNKVSRFIENIGILSSAWSVYPESFSKYKIFSWFANQTSDLLVFIEACFIADFLLLSAAVIGFFYFFIVLQKDEFFVEKVVPFYKQFNYSSFKKN